MDCLPLEGRGAFLFGLFLLLCVLTGFCLRLKRPGWGFLSHSLLLGVVVLCCAGYHLPVLMLSSTHPAHSLTLWDGSASAHTLAVLLGMTLFLLPLIISYTLWAYRVMRGRISEEHIHTHSGGLY
jgi:cytochrome d ubiquinol oxidase subunit II